MLQDCLSLHFTGHSFKKIKAQTAAQVSQWREKAHVFSPLCAHWAQQAQQRANSQQIRLGKKWQKTFQVWTFKQVKVLSKQIYLRVGKLEQLLWWSEQTVWTFVKLWLKFICTTLVFPCDLMTVLSKGRPVPHFYNRSTAFDQAFRCKQSTRLSSLI